jgi:hypothetical protein
MEFKAGITSGGVKTQVAWRVALHTHHDHREDKGLSRRFEATTMCGACNRADGFTKRHLGLKDWFSFSPKEIRKFVSATNHGRTAVDLEMAREVWEEIGPPLTAEVEAIDR